MLTTKPVEGSWFIPWEVSLRVGLLFLEGACLPLGTVLVTVETPSTNLVRKMTFAMLNMPSFNDTMIN